MASPLTLVALADTHGRHEQLEVPPGDLLIHAGDLTERGTLAELERAADFLRRLPHPHKVVIAGNHDFGFERTPAEARALFHGLTYLEDEAATVAGLRVWGTPWQPWFHSWAFNAHRGPDLDAKWRRIPEGLDLLVVHGPPAGYGDTVWSGDQVGCADLLRHLDRAAPRLVLFGHIHEARGRWRRGPTTLVNCSTAECEAPCTVLRWPVSPDDAA